MPTFKSDLIKQLESGKQITDIHKQRGALTGFMQEITIPAGMVADDIIELFILKPGEVIDPSSKMSFEALGSSTTLSVGVATDDDKYRTAQNSASAGQVNMDTSTAARTEADLASTSSQTVLLTVKGADPTADQKVFFFWKLVNEAI
jgi:hypothetical protein